MTHSCRDGVRVRRARRRFDSLLGSPTARLREALASLADDQRGAAFVESLIAFPVIFVGFLGLYQLSFVYAADLIMERAASAAARAAIVFLPEHGLGPGDGGAPAQAYVTEAARRVLLSSPVFDTRTLKVSVTGDRAGFSPVSVAVEASMDCRGLTLLCGLDGKVALASEASLPIQSDIAIER
jgi:Flp pilus assembly protein TadG